MKDSNLTPSFLYAVCLLAAVSGCQALHLYRPLPVLVRDAETKKPIPGAEVHVSYPLTISSQAPWESIGKTGADGMARMSAAPYGDVGALVEASADHYMPDSRTLSVETLKAVRPAQPFEATKERPPCVIFELYAEPRPTVELIVPREFQGLIKAAIQIDKDAGPTPGQRRFQAEVPASGTLTISGPPLLGRVFATDYCARYPDGTLLGQQPKSWEKGFWWLKTDGGYQCFLVGYQREFDRYRGSFREGDATNKQTSGESKGSGQNHHGRRNSSDNAGSNGSGS